MFKKITIAGGIMAVFLGFTASVSASNVSFDTFVSNQEWETTQGHIAFENDNDKLVVELNGMEIFVVKPDWQVIGEVAFLNKNRNFSFDINTSVNPHDVKIYVVSGETRVLVK